MNGDRKTVGIGYNGFPDGCPDERLPWAGKEVFTGSSLEAADVAGMALLTKCVAAAQFCVNLRLTLVHGTAAVGVPLSGQVPVRVPCRAERHRECDDGQPEGLHPVCLLSAEKFFF